MKTLSYSASFFEEEEEEMTEKEAAKQEKKENLMMGATLVFSMVMAIAIFMVLPYFRLPCWNGIFRLTVYGQ